ncbi:hypothetical protein HGR00_05325 [Ralstonia insidiosa]|uniref:Uncharacterized protein n=1 Tax=Ralstonia insidiosa TaxID=190721 RepID=A0A848NVM6_9RALS|nr:hypothetical protein [Ralstonia insidiosa]
MLIGTSADKVESGSRLVGQSAAAAKSMDNPGHALGRGGERIPLML